MTQQHLSLNLTGANGFAEQQSGIDFIRMISEIGTNPNNEHMY